MDELVFDGVAPVEVPVRIGGTRYVLQEAMGDAVCRWRNAVLKCTKLGPEGRPETMQGLADTEPLLVSLCLCCTDKDGAVQHDSRGEPVRVPVATVRSWRSSIVKQLFDAAKRISGLDEDTDTEERLQERIAELQERLAKLAEPKN